MQTYNGKYAMIFYNDRYVCDGMISSTKYNNGNNNMLLVSFDDEYYFNVCHKNISIKYTKQEVSEAIDISNIPCILWSEVNKNEEYPLYKEVYIDEQCVRLVNALNNIIGVETIGSCCGHDIHKYWISFLVNDIQVLRKLTELVSFNGPFKEDWVICTSKYCSVINDYNAVPLSLVCNHRSTKAYECSNKLSEYLEQVEL